jgi:hypothetical protein
MNDTIKRLKEAFQAGDCEEVFGLLPIEEKAETFIVLGSMKRGDNSSEEDDKIYHFILRWYNNLCDQEREQFFNITVKLEESINKR